MDNLPFSDWVFQQLISFGAIRDYEKNPHTGKGRSPKGNMSVQQLRIKELRESASPDDRVWGLIAYAGLMADGEIGKRLTGEVDEFCQKYNPDNPVKLFRAMSKAAKIGCEEFKKRFKEVPQEATV
jgi:hypothetical protein